MVNVISYKKTLDDLDNKYESLVFDFHRYVESINEDTLDYTIVFFDEESSPTTVETDLMSVAFNTEMYIYSIIYILDFENGHSVGSAYRHYKLEPDRLEEITDDVMRLLGSDSECFEFVC